MNNQQVDIQKILKQHLELESFFAGDFTVRGGPELFAEAPAETETAQEVSDMRSSLEDIAAQVRTCRKCQSVRHEPMPYPVRATPGHG